MDVLLVDSLGLACLVGTIAVIGWWILSPIDRAGQSRDAPVRFSIGDFLCLFVVLQVPLLATHFLGTSVVIEEEQRSFWMVTIVCWIIAPVIWFICARALSKAEISRGLYRFISLGLIVPFVYYALIPFLFLTAGSIAWLYDRDNRREEPSAWMALAWTTLFCIFFLCGVYTRWMVSQSRCAATPSSSEGSVEPDTP